MKLQLKIQADRCQSLSTIVTRFEKFSFEKNEFKVLRPEVDWQECFDTTVDWAGKTIHFSVFYQLNKVFAARKRSKSHQIFIFCKSLAGLTP